MVNNTEMTQLNVELERLRGLLQTVKRECRSPDGYHAVPLPPDVIEAIDGIGHSNVVSDAEREVERLKIAWEEAETGRMDAQREVMRLKLERVLLDEQEVDLRALAARLKAQIAAGCEQQSPYDPTEGRLVACAEFVAAVAEIERLNQNQIEREKIFAAQYAVDSNALVSKEERCKALEIKVKQLQASLQKYGVDTHKTSEIFPKLDQLIPSDADVYFVSHNMIFPENNGVIEVEELKVNFNGDLEPIDPKDK